MRTGSKVARIVPIWPGKKRGTHERPCRVSDGGPAIARSDYRSAHHLIGLACHFRRYSSNFNSLYTNGPRWIAALSQAGYPTKADLNKINWFMTEVILTIMVIYVTMVYGPIAAFLVEMFPTKIRYTSMSLPCHIGNGWFGGILPLFATALVAAYGDIYAGLWYPIVVAIMTFVIGSLMLKETKDIDIIVGSGVEEHTKA